MILHSSKYYKNCDNLISKTLIISVISFTALVSALTACKKLFVADFLFVFWMDILVINFGHRFVHIWRSAAGIIHPDMTILYFIVLCRGCSSIYNCHMMAMNMTGSAHIWVFSKCCTTPQDIARTCTTRTQNCMNTHLRELKCWQELPWDAEGKWPTCSLSKTLSSPDQTIFECFDTI